jgi:hypothetical protein
MRPIVARIIAACLGAMLSSCGTSSAPSAPASPTAPAAPSPAPGPAPSGVSGTWSGRGSDSFGPELVTWILTQSGTTISGTAQFNAVDPADGSCGSCHKVKRGTVTGTITGSSLTVTMKFPAGGDVPTPICVVDLSGSATVIERRMMADYTGTDSCEGFFSDGKIELTLQP